MTATKSDRRKARNALVKNIRRTMPHVSDPKALARKMVQQAIENLTRRPLTVSDCYPMRQPLSTDVRLVNVTVPR